MLITTDDSPLAVEDLSPSAIRLLSPAELAGVAGELRRFLIANVGRTGGHLGSNLGVIELTLAIHRLFDVGNLFRALGLDYIGPIDGHDLVALEQAFRQQSNPTAPVVVHCRTSKGRGHQPAEADTVDHMHTVPARAPEPTLRPDPRGRASRSRVLDRRLRRPAA